MEEKKFDILLIFQIIIAILVLITGVYSKVTENYNLSPLMLIFISIMLFTIGLREYKRTQSLLWRIFSLGSLLLLLFVVVDALRLIM
ncbi:DUF3953 domain-containing protein [Sporosarcina sp. SG10008]|uniref:DUF3953 domain-containing protein n=1 Tax=Sporosarcina sp. SG10008 TaxID=3373103 RepID=UPI0037DC7E4C